MPPDGKSAPVLGIKMRQNGPCAKLKQQKKRLKTARLSRFPLAGAEGIEPSALGFGVNVEQLKNIKNLHF